MPPELGGRTYKRFRDGNPAITVLCAAGCGPVVALSDGTCPWCDGATRPRTIGEHRTALVDERAARLLHRAYTEKHLSLRDLAAIVHGRFGYADERSAKNGIAAAFRRHELPLRDRVDAVRLKLGLTAGVRPCDRHLERRRQLRRQRSKSCAERRVPLDREFCIVHDPELRDEVLTIIADARGRRRAGRVPGLADPRDACHLEAKSSQDA